MEERNTSQISWFATLPTCQKSIQKSTSVSRSLSLLKQTLADMPSTWFRALLSMGKHQMYRPSRSVCQHTLVPLSILPSLCFKFKSDAIKASWDYTLNPVGVFPPAVPKHRMGNCYAKRYLIAALLRANGFPAELYYQRLISENQKPPFCLHGHHAIYLDKCGWYPCWCSRKYSLRWERLSDYLHSSVFLFAWRIREFHDSSLSSIANEPKTWPFECLRYSFLSNLKLVLCY